MHETKHIKCECGMGILKSALASHTDEGYVYQCTICKKEYHPDDVIDLAEAQMKKLKDKIKYLRAKCRGKAINDESDGYEDNLIG
jgi:DNA-directed RNA polymerase subunit RPC12/RpoP